MKPVVVGNKWADLDEFEVVAEWTSAMIGGRETRRCLAKRRDGEPVAILLYPARTGLLAAFGGALPRGMYESVTPAEAVVALLGEGQTPPPWLLDLAKDAKL